MSLYVRGIAVQTFCTRTLSAQFLYSLERSGILEGKFGGVGQDSARDGNVNMDVGASEIGVGAGYAEIGCCLLVDGGRDWLIKIKEFISFRVKVSTGSPLDTSAQNAESLSNNAMVLLPNFSKHNVTTVMKINSHLFLYLAKL